MNPSRAARVILVGIGGMGHYLLEALRTRPAASDTVVAAAVDPHPENAPSLGWIKDAGIPLFPSLDETFSAGISADLVFIASPIHYHVPQSILALERGSSVLCEKPLAAAIQEADRLIEGERNAPSLWVEIGYQWSYSDAVASLKGDILEGIYGTPIRLKSLCLWPRPQSYYSRNSWAGRMGDRGSGWVLDSPANNAMAHFLHNMLYTLGPSMERSAEPADMEAEAFRVYPVETFDTVACRLHTKEGWELLFYASHTTEGSLGPIFDFVFTEGRVRLKEGGGIIGEGRRGRRDYGSPDRDPLAKVDFVLDRWRRGGGGRCGPGAARAQTLAVNGIHRSLRGAGRFPERLIRRRDDFFLVEGLGEDLRRCYEKGCLPSEDGWTDAVKGRLISLAGYRHFPGGSADNEEGRQ